MDDGHTVTVRMFGRLRELAVKDVRSLTVAPGATVTDVVRDAFSLEPAIADIVRAEDAGTAFAVALDRRYVEPSTPVGDAAEIALIPPVSGG